MAKGIIPLASFRERFGDARRPTIHSALLDAFVAAIHGEES
jgi:hypothetical protein